MVVAVTGARGIVGSAIIQKLSEKNITARPIFHADCDILDMAGLTKALEGADAVIHAAGFVSFNPRRKNKILDINVQGTRNVVNACLTHGTKKLIHISSVAALGIHRRTTIINEETRWTPGAPVTDYAVSKYLAELEVFRGMEEGLHVSVLNPSVVLSAGDGKRSSSQLFGYVWDQRQFFTDFMMNYVDARDVGEMAARLLQGNYNGEKFIASAGSIPVRQMFQLIAQRFKKRAPGIHVPVGLTTAVARLEEWRSAITGSEPVFTRQSVRLLREEVVFENAKAKKVLGMEFQTLESSLDWCCDIFRANNLKK